MNTTNINAKIFVEYLTTSKIDTEIFHLSIEEMEEFSGKLNFINKSTGQKYISNFYIISEPNYGRVDITLIIFKVKFRFWHNGIIKGAHIINSEPEYFQESIDRIISIF